MWVILSVLFCLNCINNFWEEVLLVYVFFVICNICILSPLSPDEYKSKVVCEDERMRLSCKRGMQIAVYSAMFGRTQQGTLECPLHHRRAPSVGEAPSHSHTGVGKMSGWGSCSFTQEPRSRTRSITMGCINTNYLFISYVKIRYH